VSYIHVQQLEALSDECAAASAAIAYLARVWHEARTSPEVTAISYADVREAADNVETTYIIRLFSGFEALLVEHLAALYPQLRIPRTAEALINRVALRERIPDPIRDLAHNIREYRNMLVHRRPPHAPVISFREVRSALNRFLVRLRDRP
jgi:hypothetical protein